MRYSEIISAAFKALRILPARLKPKVLKHALGLSLLSLADFVGLVVLLPLLVVLLRSGLNPDYRLGQFPDWYRYVFLVVVLCFFLLKALSAFYLQKKQVKIVGEIIRFVSENNIRHFLNLPYEKRLETDTSLFSEKVYFQPLYVGQGIFVPLFVLFQESVILLFIVCGLILFYPYISLGLMLVLLVSGAITNKWIRKRTINLGGRNTQKRQKLFDNLGISLSGMLDIKQNQAQERFQADLSGKVYDLATGELETNTVRIIPFRVNELISVVGLVVLILYALLINPAENFVVLGSIFALAMFRSVPAINRIQLNLVQVRLHYNHIKNLTTDLYPDIENESLPPVSSEIRLHKISLAYHNNCQAILSEIDLTIPCGTITVFSGVSGSGKSSLLRIIAGQMQASSGDILIDGKKLSPAHLVSWQNQVSLISQKPFIQKEGIAENLAFGSSEPIDYERVEEALSMAGLTEFLKNLDSRQIGEEGFKISEGQKQRLMLARAIYKQSRVLLLDEITANLDPENTLYIVDTLKQLKQSGHTIILISHNPEVLNIADLLCTFKNKRIYINDHSESES